MAAKDPWPTAGRRRVHQAHRQRVPPRVEHKRLIGRIEEVLVALVQLEIANKIVFYRPRIFLRLGGQKPDTFKFKQWPKTSVNC